MTYVVAILGLAVLMIVHEAGHYFAARAFGLRVTKFSIGFGPTFFRVEPKDGIWQFVSFGDRVKLKLFKHDPEKHGPTVFQVAMIPFLAYVQIAGMNSLEEVDPRDKGSYANAGLWGRIVTIFAGPAANYVFASIFFFFPIYVDGITKAGGPTQIEVAEGQPAQAAGFRDGDKIVSVGGQEVQSWEAMSGRIVESAEKEIPVVVEREGERVELAVTPVGGPNCPSKACIGVRHYRYKVPATFKEASVEALSTPPLVVKNMLLSLSELVRGKSEEKLGGPIRMVQEMKKVAEVSWADFIKLLGLLSAYLAAFNLLPIPALDGGRLMFLGYEAATRKRADPKVELHIHAIGLAMMLGLMLYVTFANDLGLGGSK
jgi:regulator of sigma E protease